MKTYLVIDNNDGFCNYFCFAKKEDARKKAIDLVKDYATQYGDDHTLHHLDEIFKKDHDAYSSEDGQITVELVDCEYTD